MDMNVSVTAIVTTKRQALHSSMTQSSRKAQMPHSLSLVCRMFVVSKQFALLKVFFGLGFFESHVSQAESGTPSVDEDDLISTSEVLGIQVCVTTLGLLLLGLKSRILYMLGKYSTKQKPSYILSLSFVYCFLLF